MGDQVEAGMAGVFVTRAPCTVQIGLLDDGQPCYRNHGVIRVGRPPHGAEWCQLGNV